MMLDGLSCPEHPSLVQVRHGGGTITYVVSAAPDALSPVTQRDLARAWDAARRSTSRARPPCRLRFEGGDGSSTEFAVVDSAARKWADAVEEVASLRTFYGLSLLVRLLALSAELLPHTGSGTSRRNHVPDPGRAVLRAAAGARLTPFGGFDATSWRTLLAEAAPLAKESCA